MTVLAAAVLVVASARSQELATDTPEATVQTLHRGLIESAQSTVGLEQRYRALQPLIVATHDLPYIAEFSIRRQWPTISVEDRQRFTAAFEKLSVMTYASRFKAVSEDTFKVTGEGQVTAGRAQITAAIKRTDAPDLPLDYLLHERDGSWKVINIVADGVSDLALKRAEYQGILTSGSIDDLIAHLEAQTARLE
ncbi:MAG TPA: ABC transporter substrate-binding protein [Gammaproteobacteria bacterium]|nr:ABC transporter substrate-binding protein [Gammaproteobacteria bacterium]